ncbi:hypothetical protein EDC51_1032 [Bibersteinia trehalosi]|uniref:hypothetical protein n=1 Tax=Bibersteinia trehalosi TaxID=47735 RepID=UPI00104C1914|nr:hypothetical protein [Bibersteinia trehalosi]TCT17255.1 hypothetical protein EDC51_1032 [Bibersteinia trehalosi]
MCLNKIIIMLVELAKSKGISKEELCKLRDENNFMMFGLDYSLEDIDLEINKELEELSELINRLKEHNEDLNWLNIAIKLQDIGNYFIYLNEDIRKIISMQ